jgi:hypothetical protein
MSRVTLPDVEVPIIQVQNESDRRIALSIIPLRRHQMPIPLEKYRPFKVMMLTAPADTIEGLRESTSGGVTYWNVIVFNAEPRKPSITRTSTTVAFVVRGATQVITLEPFVNVQGTKS